MVLRSDVQALFPSLSKERTARAVRAQAEKADIQWENIDSKWLRLYIHLNKHLSENISPVAHLLPVRRKGKRGAEPGMGSFECNRRHITEEFMKGNKLVKSSWIWPEIEPTDKEIKTLMAIMLEISVKYFFDNFVYTFGGLDFLQSSGGPIGARLTMAISRLVMQEWWDQFALLLERSNLKYLLKSIYVDDGRLVIALLNRGIRYSPDHDYLIWDKNGKKKMKT